MWQTRAETRNSGDIHSLLSLGHCASQSHIFDFGGSRPGVCFKHSCKTAAAVSSGRVYRNVPFGALPTAVLNDVTITASFIIPPNSSESRLQAAFLDSSATTDGTDKSRLKAVLKTVNCATVFRSSMCAEFAREFCAVRRDAGTLRAPNRAGTVR